MTNVTPVKLTEAESDLVEWVMHRTQLVSRSGVLRSALLDLARRLDAPGELLRRCNLARMTARPRASKKVAARRRTG
jgi:hypothetical protein